MEIKYYTKEEKHNMYKQFLIIPKKFKKYKDKDDIYWIYKIFNIKNNKIYIGKTKDIHKRSLIYINEYCKGFNDRKINKAMNELGIESFIMSPIEIAYTNKSASIKEKYYIDLYDSIDNGYNTIIGSSTSDIKNRRHTSVSQTLYAKMSKSKIICAINDSTSEIIFSTGLKLFGDYINRHKDEIKSAAKRETRLDGYFLFYMNKKDLESQIDNAMNKLKKNSIYSDCNLQYKDFILYSLYLKKFMKTGLNEKNFEIKCIVQDNSKKGYKYISFDSFKEYYNTITNKIV